MNRHDPLEKKKRPSSSKLTKLRGGKKELIFPIKLPRLCLIGRSLNHLITSPGFYFLFPINVQRRLKHRSRNEAVVRYLLVG